jgi:hypothetical protein
LSRVTRWGGLAAIFWRQVFGLLGMTLLRRWGCGRMLGSLWSGANNPQGNPESSSCLWCSR